jgi:hypothetical protein
LTVISGASPPLFSRSPKEVEERNARSARLLLDADCEAGLRDLLARETRCCSFFDFEIAPAERHVALTVRVPNGSEAALAFLLDLTRARATS